MTYHQWLIMSETLKQKTARGLFWATVNSGGTQVLNLVIGIFLARLLSPADYGVVGVLAIFTAIAGCLQESGFTQAIINLKNPTEKDYNSVFWFNITVSLTLYVILFFCAPIIALWFHQPILEPLSRLLFVTFILSALGIVPNAMLMKQVRQREKAAISLTALVVSGLTGIILAWQGYSYWALVWLQVTYNLVTLIGRYIVVRWLPAFHFSAEPIRRMFGFGSKLLLTSIVNAVSLNVLSVIFGRMYKIDDVGNYTQAAKWELMGHSLITYTITQVAQPVMAELNNEQQRQQQAFRKLLRFTAFLTLPVMFGLALVAHEFIIIAISAKWEAAVPLLQLLCLGGAALPFHALYQQLAISRGRSDIYMWCGIGLIVAQMTLVLLLSSQPIIVLVAVYAALHVVWLAVLHATAGKLIALRWTDMLRDILPFVLITLFVMGITYVATQWITKLWLLLVARILLAVVLYVLIMYLTKAQIFREAIAFLRRS